ncbi:MAG TPA: hypothetical protein VF578_14010 [Methylomirabilota bacterium]
MRRRRPIVGPVSILLAMALVACTSTTEQGTVVMPLYEQARAEQ